MSDTPFHYRYHGDALNGYMCLTLEERGAYTTILDLIYDRGGPIPEQERLISGYLNVSLRKARSLLNSLIEKGKIYRTEDGRIGNERADKELEKASEKRRKHAESGAKGGRKSAETKKKSNKNNSGGQAPLKHQPHTTIHKDTNVSSISFDDFWEVVPMKVGKGDARRAYARAIKKAAPEVIFAAMKDYTASRRGQDQKYTKHPASWLNAERWNDEIQQPHLTPINGGHHEPSRNADRLQRIVTAAAEGTSGQGWG